ncbi:Uncharacterized protein GBIM_12672 [Gryllus bimaculatus]|nr:Uncharacterized protein GBIM_12672 [Gryllus bimaculatus]
MASTSVIKSVPPQDLLTELRTFVAGATRAVKTNPLELARTALSLLKTLPAARDAVLEYFCTLFDSAVSKYVAQIENDANPSGGHEEATIAEIHSVLCNFVSNNPEAWAPIISTWSLELLGELSSRYAGRARVPLGAGLNESLQLWMSCRATRTLIDITTQCLSCLMHSNTETCINALLNTSVAHSPHFDWVVAHVGSCFPQTVITRVLSCGLKDFCQHGSMEQGAKSPKVLSVVGILGHLAASHIVSIRLALLDLFKWSLQPPKPGEEAQRRATVPFLLQLGSLSINVDMLPQLAELAPGWCIYFGGRQALEDLIVHLARNCEEGGTQMLHLLLDASSPVDASKYHSNVALTSRRILELLLQELDLMLRSAGPGAYPIPLLDSIRQNVASIQPLLLSSDLLRVQIAVRLFGLLAHHSPAVLVNAVAFLLQRATKDEHLAAVMRLVTDAVCASAYSTSSLDKERGDSFKNNYLAQALEQAIRNSANNDLILDDNIGQVASEQLWLNLARMLKWEISRRPRALEAHLISDAVCACLREASELLRCPPEPAVAHAVASTLDLVDILGQNHRRLSGPKLKHMIRLTKAIVAYFFLCVSEKDWVVRLKGANVCCRLLTQLAIHSAAIRSLALRELLEGALFHAPTHLFGATTKISKDRPPEVRLLHENHKQGTSVILAHRHSSMFHAGVIGNGPYRHTSVANTIPQEDISENISLLIDVIKACCTNPTAGDQNAPNSLPTSLDAVTNVSLLLVELLSPDVMYNGLPWPEEEFSKVTVERDLSIRQRFDELPITWALLSFVASHRPALCYCSVLLRALTATLMAQWAARRSAGPSPDLCSTTVRLLELLALGQLLPPPLASLRELIPHLLPQEVVQLLRDCVWNYMRDNVPSPALFTRDASGLMWRDATLAIPGPQYTDSLRFIIQKNIKKLGYLYPQLFPDTSK